MRRRLIWSGESTFATDARRQSKLKVYIANKDSNGRIGTHEMMCNDGHYRSVGSLSAFTAKKAREDDFSIRVVSTYSLRSLYLEYYKSSNSACGRARHSALLPQCITRLYAVLCFRR